MKTQTIADDLVIHVCTLDNAEQLQRAVWPLAKAHHLKYITLMAASGERPLTISVRQLERLTNRHPQSSLKTPPL